MKGKTNVYLSKGGGEKLHLTLKTNQSTHTDIVGAVVTVSYNDVVETYTWEGTELVISVPEAVLEYTVSYSSFDKYQTPTTTTYKPKLNYNRFITSTYKTEKVTVTVKTNTTTSAVGQKITINGTAYTYNSAITVYIPFGTSYTISANTKKWYNTPSKETYTASLASRNVTMIYTAKEAEIYIQGISKKKYTASTWANLETPNGIAILTEKASFVVALDNTSYYKSGTLNDYECCIDYQDLLFINLLNISYLSDAYNHFDGSTDFASQIWTYYYSRDTVVDLSFPDGSSGYVGSVGEWKIVHDNIDTIESLITLCGGVTFTSLLDNLPYLRYATSTKKSNTAIWAYSDRNNTEVLGFYALSASTYYLIRPFKTI